MPRKFKVNGPTGRGPKSSLGMGPLGLGARVAKSAGRRWRRLTIGRPPVWPDERVSTKHTNSIVTYLGTQGVYQVSAIEPLTSVLDNLLYRTCSR